MTSAPMRASRLLPEVLLIHPNERDVGVEPLVVRRPKPVPAMPSTLATPPKVHQLEGLAWLQQAWTTGLPGVLLADDMGLGKTLQGLAFLVWLRQGMAAGAIPREALLVMAPTGLLANWQKEHSAHLASLCSARVCRRLEPGCANFGVAIRAAGPS